MPAINSLPIPHSSHAWLPPPFLHKLFSHGEVESISAFSWLGADPWLLKPREYNKSNTARFPKLGQRSLVSSGLWLGVWEHSWREGNYHLITLRSLLKWEVQASPVEDYVKTQPTRPHSFQPSQTTSKAYNKKFLCPSHYVTATLWVTNPKKELTKWPESTHKLF